MTTTTALHADYCLARAADILRLSGDASDAPAVLATLTTQDIECECGAIDTEV